MGSAIRLLQRADELLRLDPRIGEHLAGARSIGAPERSEFLRAVATDDGAGPDEFIAECGRLQDLREALLQAIDNIARRSGRNEKTIPREDLDARQACFGERGLSAPIQI